MRSSLAAATASPEAGTMKSPLPLLAAMILLASVTTAAQVLDLGSRRELMVDHHLIDSLEGAELRLQEPHNEGVAFAFDRPQEGLFSGYVSIVTLPNDAGYRAYYRGLPVLARAGSPEESTSYAESRDGITWTKPADNVTLRDERWVTHNLSVFYDTKPGVPADERWKGIGGLNTSGLIRVVSGDGIAWRKPWGDEPILPAIPEEKKMYRYDSQNLAFWSESEQQYVCYFRHVRAVPRMGDRVRLIGRATSPDFVNWTDEGEMSFHRADGSSAPTEHLYTNQTSPYFRAPHLYVAIAARFLPGRQVLNEAEAKEVGVSPKYFNDISDSVLMTTRGGTVYDRTFMEGFARPGIGLGNWTSRTNYPALNVIQTGPAEMSFYVQKGYGQPDHRLERYSLRLDGFASLHAGYDGGEMVTKPFTFSGDTLEINYATSAAGSIRIEIQDRDGRPIPGYTLADAREIIGDQIARTVTWSDGPSVDKLQGKTIRLRVVLEDADLFSLKFQ
ncbi:MAG: hypothetical protein SynsKO_27070 [Synoicihabitans sp.]